MEERDIKIINR